jgi:hypothetical protein
MPRHATPFRFRGGVSGSIGDKDGWRDDDRSVNDSASKTPDGVRRRRTRPPPSTRFRALQGFWQNDCASVSCGALSTPYDMDPPESVGR